MLILLLQPCDKLRCGVPCRTGGQMRYRYELAGTDIRVEVPFELHIQQESLEFVEKWENEEECRADIFLKLKESEYLPLPMEASGYRTGGQYFEKDEEGERIFYSIAPHDKPYACVCWNRERTVGECLYLKGKEDCLNYSRNIWDMLNMESLMLCRGGLLLHSSFIRFEGKAVLFSAPCGTGKSTQADLWKKYENADIINGDRAGLRYMEGEWRAYGLPYAGSSGIYRNENASLAGIIVLKQAKENSLRKMEPVEAFPELYREITVHRWDQEFVLKSTELLMKLLEEVPVYLLECRPDYGAVKLVRDKMFGCAAERSRNSMEEKEEL